ncbi:MAG: ABC transporter substrate-binding protein [Alphaproteobacteria bacterium]|nr:ABC transporter substrate-binding protein [Alphaproteobacteria bacterium]
MPRNTLTRRTILAAPALIGAAIAPREAASQSIKVLKTRSLLDVAVLDPANRISVTDGDVMRAIFAGLVTQKSGDVWGWDKDLAVEIEQSDPTHIRFQLRPGVAWSNGFGEVMADDVKFSYERMADPAFKAAYRTDWDFLDRVDVTGPHSGVIVLKRPFVPLWSSTLPAGSGLILCRKAVEPLEGRKFTLDPPATNGPYRIKKLDPRRSITLERNPLWTGKRPAYDEIQYIQIVDSNAAEIAYQAGEIDFTQVPLSNVPRLRKSPPPNSRLHVAPSLAYWWLGMQSEAGPFADIRVRRAVQYALDVEMILDGTFLGVAERATGFIAPSLLGRRKANKIVKPDPARARALLAEAGLARGFKTNIGVRNSTEFLSAAQIAAASLAEIGIIAEVIPFDAGQQKALAGDKNGRWKEMGIMISRFTMQPDPSWATAWFVSSQIGEWNFERFSNAEFDRLHEEAKGELDQAKRQAMYERMQDILEESGSYVFLTNGATASLHRNSVKPALSPDGQFQMWSDFAPA